MGSSQGFWSIAVDVFAKACSLCTRFTPTADDVSGFGLDADEVWAGLQAAALMTSKVAKQYLRTLMVSEVEQAFAFSLRSVRSSHSCAHSSPTGCTCRPFPDGTFRWHGML